MSQKISHSRVTAAVMAAMGSVAIAAPLSVVSLSGDSTTADDTFLGIGISQIALDNLSNVAAITSVESSEGDDDIAVTFASVSGGVYTTNVVARASQNVPVENTTSAYGSFENLSLTNGTVVFSSRKTITQQQNSFADTGIFRSVNAALPSAVFHSTHNDPTRLDTPPNALPPAAYGVSSDGHVAFGLRTLSDGSQSLHLDNSANALQTGGIQHFNLDADDAAFRVKIVASSTGVVAVAQRTSDASYGVYDLTHDNGPSRRYGSIESNTLAPRQLLGATAEHSFVVAQRLDNPAQSRLVYESSGVASSFTADFATGGGPGSTTEQLIVGQMSAGGNAVAYVPGLGLAYHDANGATQFLSLNANVGNKQITGFGFDGNGATPMVNDHGWVVTGVLLTGGIEALIAWKPTIDSATDVHVVAKTDDVFTRAGHTYAIASFENLNQNLDTDYLKDGLNEFDKIAFGVTYDDVNPTTGAKSFGGSAILFGDAGGSEASPEPASAVMVGASLCLVIGSRRPRRTPR